MKGWKALLVIILLILAVAMVTDYILGGDAILGIAIGVILFVVVRAIYDTIEEPERDPK